MNNMDNQPINTPYYLYDMELLNRTLESAKSEADKYNFHVHYAIKANSNEPILNTIAEKGFGADCVSGNEVLHAIKCGFDPAKVAFAGVGKTDEEINVGLDNDIFSFNVESQPELEIINELALAKGKVARIALRINPNVDANTHQYITTGMEENKFGINMWELEGLIEKMKDLTAVKLVGIHFHIGSQITDFNVFKNLCQKVNRVQDFLIEHQIIVEHLNMGGGLGIDYHEPHENPISDFEQYFAIFNQFLEVRPGQEVHFELGRSLVAQCGSLISQVIYVKKGAVKQFAIVDASMTDLMRPALYQSFHHIDVVQSEGTELQKYDVVGPVCESTDVFRKEVELTELKRGDQIALRSAGAYGQAMASEYNMRSLAEAVYWYEK